METSSAQGDNTDIKEWRVHTLHASQVIKEPLVQEIQTEPVNKLPVSEELNVISPVIKENLVQEEKPEKAEELQNIVEAKKLDATTDIFKEIEEPLENDEASNKTKDSTAMLSDDKDKEKTGLNKTNIKLPPTASIQDTVENTERANDTQKSPDSEVNKPINVPKKLTDSIEVAQQQTPNVLQLSPRSIGKYPINYKVSTVEELQRASLGFQPLTMDIVTVPITCNQHESAKPAIVKPAVKETPKHNVKIELQEPEKSAIVRPAVKETPKHDVKIESQEPEKPAIVKPTVKEIPKHDVKIESQEPEKPAIVKSVVKETLKHKTEPQKPEKPAIVKPAVKKTTKEISYYEKVSKTLEANQAILKTITPGEFDVYMANLVCNMKPNSKPSSKEIMHKYIADFERAKKHETVPHQVYLETLWKKEQLRVKEPELKVVPRKVTVQVQCVRKKKDGFCLQAIRAIGYLTKTSIEMLGLTNIIPKPEGIVY